MRAHRALAALAVLAATVVGGAPPTPSATQRRGLEDDADDPEPLVAEAGSHLTMCLAVADGGQAAREHFCDLLAYYPKPGVQYACATKVFQRKIVWQAWCQITFRWHPWQRPAVASSRSEAASFDPGDG